MEEKQKEKSIKLGSHVRAEKKRYIVRDRDNCK